MKATDDDGGPAAATRLGSTPIRTRDASSDGEDAGCSDPTPGTATAHYSHFDDPPVQACELDARHDGHGRWRAHPLTFTMITFAGIAVLVWFVACWSVLHPPPVAPVGAPVPGSAELPVWFQGWAHWDGAWYQTISRDGYDYQPGTQSSVAFFPVYPMLIRLVGALAPNSPSPLIVGSVLTLTSGMAAIALVWTWCRWRFDAATATTAALLFAVYPYSIYLYGPVYADALFIAAALGAFVLLERNYVLAAALVGAVASAVRPAGVIVALALVVRLVEIRHAERDFQPPNTTRRRWRDRWNPAILCGRDSAILGSFAGFVAYAVYLAARFGDPFAYATTQSSPGWDQGAGPQTWFKEAMITEIRKEPLGPAALGLMLQLAVVVLVIAAVPFVARRVGRAYALLTGLLAVMVTFGSKDFQGAGRYLLLAIVPVAALSARFLVRHRSLRALALGGGLVALLYFASWFAKGNYLA